MEEDGIVEIKDVPNGRKQFPRLVPWAETAELTFPVPGHLDCHFFSAQEALDEVAQLWLTWLNGREIVSLRVI